MIKQAMILAAGKGERMLPLTQNLPKPLLKIGDTTLIGRHLKHLADAGIERVVINTHYLGELIVATLGTEQFGMEIIYSKETQLLETAGGIRAALPLLGKQPFLVVNGDIYTEYPFQQLTTINPSRLPYLVMVRNPPHHPEGDFSVDDSQTLRDSGDRRTYSGIGVYSSDFFDGQGDGSLKLRALFDAAIPEGALFGEAFDGVWWDIGTPKRLEAVRALVQ